MKTKTADAGKPALDLGFLGAMDMTTNERPARRADHMKTKKAKTTEAKMDRAASPAPDAAPKKKAKKARKISGGVLGVLIENAIEDAKAAAIETPTAIAPAHEKKAAPAKKKAATPVYKDAASDSKPARRFAKIGDHSPTAAARWMGAQGMSFAEATAALASFGITLEATGLKWQLAAGTKRTGSYAEASIPEITGPLAGQLLAFKTPATPPPPAAPKKARKAKK